MNRGGQGGGRRAGSGVSGGIGCAQCCRRHRRCCHRRRRRRGGGGSGICRHRQAGFERRAVERARVAEPVTFKVGAQQRAVAALVEGLRALAVAIDDEAVAAPSFQGYRIAVPADDTCVFLVTKKSAINHSRFR